MRLTSAPHILCLLVNDTLLTLTFTLQTQEYKTAGEIAGESGDLQDRIAELQDEVWVLQFALNDVFVMSIFSCRCHIVYRVTLFC